MTCVLCDLARSMQSRLDHLGRMPEWMLPFDLRSDIRTEITSLGRHRPTAQGAREALAKMVREQQGGGR